MTTIAITGAGGQLGTRLVRALDADPAVDRIIGIDRSPPRHLVPRHFEYRPADIRDADLDRVLKDVDVLVHLAYRFDPMRDEAAMRATNVEGTRNVFEAAARAGVARVVYPSSVVVYGAHPDNDMPLTEDSVLRAIPDYPYAQHKLEVEQWLWPWAQDTVAVPALSVLRFGLMLGPGLQNSVTRGFEAPRIPVISGHRPPLQFLHPDDAVSAIQHVIAHELDGVFNVCADGWLSFDEVTAIVGRRTVEVPEEVAYSSTQRLWTLGLGEQPPGVLSVFMHPWVMSAAKLHATGWRPRHSNRDAVAAMAEEHRDYLAVPGVRVKRRTARLIALGTTLVTLAGLVQTVRVARRRWRAFRAAR